MCHSFANHPSCQSLDEVGLSGQRPEDFRRPTDLGNIHWGRNFPKPRNYHCTKPYLCLVTNSYSDKLILRRIQYFIT